MIPVKYNLRSLVVRRVGTAMTVFGVALTVALFVSILALASGLANTFVESGDPLNLIMIRQGSQTETNSFFNRDIKSVVEATEGVTAVSGEIVILVNLPRVTGETTNVMARGISDKSFELRPKVKMVEGRMFRSGLREIIVSRPISGRFKSMKLGDKMKMGLTWWTIVGIFDASHTPYDSEIWGDYNEISGEFKRYIYSSLLVRCNDEGSAAVVREKLAADRRIQLDVFGQRQYFEAQTPGTSLKVIGYLLASIMAIGSSFAVMNTMYAAAAYRTREIATLRIMGFKRRNILLSFMIESLILSLLGGALGCILALPMNGVSTGIGNMTTFSEVAFQFRVTPRLLLDGMIFAAVMGTLGGLLPARLASKLTMVRALRMEV